MDLEVTSVTKKNQKLSESAAAIHVITNDDIIRSGVTNIPGALRMVPGLQVARIDSNKWAVSARGFNSRLANKLLVLIDGRTVYSPTFSGVYWEVQDTVMDDIDRIEVIRGPGASLWGSNAVNGVINIITKHSEKPQGGSLSIGSGTYENGLDSVRYGAKLGDETNGRVYLKGFQRDSLSNITGGNDDQWNMVRTGFRLDYTSIQGDAVQIQGVYYRGDLNQSLDLATLLTPYRQNVVDQVDTSGWNLLDRWKKAISLDSDIQLQIYFDHSQRNEYIFDEQRDTFDFDFQHHFNLGQHQNVVWGLGYKLSKDNFRPSSEISFLGNERDYNLWSAFLQDEIALFDEKVRLTIGSKFEHNDYTGIEIQPNARLALLPNSHHSIWGGYFPGCKNTFTLRR